MDVEVNSKNTTINVGFAALLIPLSISSHTQIPLNILATILTIGIAYDLINGRDAFKAGFAKGKQFGTPKGVNTPKPSAM